MTVRMPLEGASPFADLPSALVDDVVGQTSFVAAELLKSFASVKEERKSLRRKLKESGLVIADSTLDMDVAPTTCATDGSYAIERLLMTDLVAAAAVAVEGLAPPTERRHWEFPRHKCFVAAEPHFTDTSTIVRAIMLGEELRLLVAAPHDLLMLDGTFTLPIIYFNQALNQIADTSQLKCSQEFADNCCDYLEKFLEALQSRRTDKQFAAFPKYSTRREIGRKLRWPSNYDDRGILSILLDAGELTRPIPLDSKKTGTGDSTWHLNTGELPDSVRSHAAKVAKAVVAAADTIHVMYYKPRAWIPAIRVEVPASVALNSHRLASVVQGIKHQSVAASMLEPYPIYFADRIVKSLARAMPAFRQVTTQQISEDYDGDIGEIYFALHGFRSETGR